jgi:hypothetical protein
MSGDHQELKAIFAQWCDGHSLSSRMKIDVLMAVSHNIAKAQRYPGPA